MRTGFKVEMFDKQGYARNWDEVWCLYAAFAPTGKSETLVKIGVSCKVYDRMVSLRGCCQYPIKITLWTPVGKRRDAYSLETLLHKAFSDRRQHGEWFRFDMQSPSDKALFHDTTKNAFAHATGYSLSWKKISAEQVDEYQKMTGKKQLTSRISKQ